MDQINVEILEDGTVSVSTESISQAAHFSADQLLDEIAEMVGGTTTKTPKEAKFWVNRTVALHGKIKKVGA
jgi:hypothetical protein